MAGADDGSHEQLIDDALLEHAERCWESEVHNAERLTLRSNLLLSTSIGLVALGVWRFLPVARDALVPPFRRVDLAAVGLFAASALFFVLAFKGFLGIRLFRPSAPAAPSARKLAFKRWQLQEMAARTDLQRMFVFQRTYRAFQDLHARNNRERHRQVWCVRAYVFALALLLAAMMTYTLGGSGAEARGGDRGQEALSHDNYAARSR